MTHPDLIHKLAAILAADAVGFSRLMSRGEREAVAALDNARAVFRAQIEAHQGRVVDMAGDAILATFESASAAMAAALAVQRGLAADPPAVNGQPLHFRIGIHVGDVFQKHDGTMYGDGINIAARLQALAEPGGLVVSEAVRTVVGGRVDIEFLDLGTPYLKNIAESIRAFTARPAGTGPGASASLALAAQRIPFEPTRLFGRAADIEQLSQWVVEDRLVTILGTGGIGKTQVARRLLRVASEAFRGDVAWVDLSPLSSLQHLLTSTANATAVQLAGEDSDSVTGLAHALTHRNLLLVLDNSEHLVPEVCALVQAVLHAAPGVHLVVTSQQVLKLAAERVYRLQPLSLPPQGMNSAGAAGYSAVEMLLERAGAADHRFALTAQNADDIVALSNHLDGLPLAIEMAAAWLPKLGARSLLERLSEWRQMLRAPAQGMPARHQTLRSTLEWSHSLLAPVQQKVLHRLSAFAGTFRVDMVHPVAGGDTLDEPATLEVLASLIDKSLVQAVQLEPPRYSLLETMRVYAGELLEAEGEAAPTHARLGRVLAGLAREVESRFWSMGDRDWLALYAPEYDDLQIAFDRACAFREVDTAAMIGTALQRMDQLRSITTAGRKRAELLFAMLGEANDEARAWIWTCLTSHNMISLEIVSRMEASTQALAAWRRRADPMHLHFALGFHANECARAGDFVAADAALAEAASLERPTWPVRRRMWGASARRRVHPQERCRRLPRKLPDRARARGHDRRRTNRCRLPTEAGRRRADGRRPAGSHRPRRGRRAPASHPRPSRLPGPGAQQPLLGACAHEAVARSAGRRARSPALALAQLGCALRARPGSARGRRAGPMRRGGAPPGVHGELVPHPFRPATAQRGARRPPGGSRCPGRPGRGTVRHGRAGGGDAPGARGRVPRGTPRRDMSSLLTRLRGGLCLAALACPLVASAQPIPCSRLPQAERAAARQAGLCADDDQSAAQRRAAAAAAAAAAKAQVPPTAFTCPDLPDFAANRALYDEAVRSLPRGFRPRVTERRPSSAPASTVLAQSAEVLEGRACWASFVLSDGSLVRVPKLRGLTRDEALQRVQASRLRADMRELPSDAVEPGRVFAQRPEAEAEVGRESVVLVAVARPTTIEVPDVVRRNIDDARLRLSRFGVNTTQEASARPAGEVLGQDPAAGGQAKPGSEVTLALSDGSLVEVPDLAKSEVSRARELLEKSELRADVVEDASDAPPGTVATQDPAPGTVVARRSAVTLHVSAGLAVPDLVGRQLGDVQDAMKPFTVETEPVASDRPAGEILSQAPAAGGRAGAQERLTLRVSDGSIVTVPALHGMTLAEARRELLRLGDLSAAVPEGGDRADAIVDASAPPAGQPVKRGSTIVLTLVPAAPWWPWAAGGALLLAGGIVGLSKAWRRKPSRPGAAADDIQLSASMEFNSRPIEARTGAPEVPAIGLRAELVRGAVVVRQDREEET